LDFFERLAKDESAAELESEENLQHIFAPIKDTWRRNGFSALIGEAAPVTATLINNVVNNVGNATASQNVNTAYQTAVNNVVNAFPSQRQPLDSEEDIMYFANVRPTQSAASSSGALPAIRGPSNDDGHHLTRIGHLEMPPAAPPVKPREKPRPPQGKAHALTVAPRLDSHCGVKLHYVCSCGNDHCTKEGRQDENGVFLMHAGVHGCQECEEKDGFYDKRTRCGAQLPCVCRCGNDRCTKSRCQDRRGVFFPGRTHGCKECEDKIHEHNRIANWNETFRLAQIENRRMEEDQRFQRALEQGNLVDEVEAAAAARLTQEELKEKEIELRHDLLRQQASRLVDITKAAAARASMPPPAAPPAKKAKAAPPVHPTHLVVPPLKAAPSHDQARNFNNNMDNDPLFRATVMGGEAPPAQYDQVRLKPPPGVKANPAIT
jgi:hypothetical protein